MGVAMNGSGINGENGFPMISGMITTKNTNSSGVRIGAMTKKSSSGVKKRLNYNHREISGQLVRCKKAQGAANVLARARTKISVLKRCEATGKYDSREIANAMAHARRMVRCAQMKVRHLKEEELDQKKYKRENSADKQHVENEVKRRAANKERELKEKVQIETAHKVQAEKTKHQQMMQKQRAHRRQEQSRINEADMKYLKGEIENHRYNGVSPSDGVILSLSAEAALLNEAQIRLQAEQEAELEVEIEMDVSGSVDSTGTVISGASAPEGTASAEASAEAAVGGSVDISL